MKGTKGGKMRITVFLACLFLAVSAFAESYVGIGITIQNDKDDFYIIGLSEGGPAERAGVLVDDQVVTVDGKETHGKKLKEVVKWLSGEINAPVVLGLVHPKAGARELTVVREEIEIKCVMEGSVSLSVSGDEQNGSVSGWVGRDHVNWNVFGGRVFSTFKGNTISLNVRREIGTNRTEISGWFRNGRIDWYGYNHISGYQRCIQ
jgi:PDZ domain